MEKEFISYRQALALKELGFYEPVINVYDFKSKELVLNEDDEMIWAPVLPNNGATIAAPLYQQAFRWFRENTDYGGFIEPSIKEGHYDWVICTDDDRFCECGETYPEYEGAESACLDKLIEICKNIKNE
jgi:hypothetical protein